MYFKKHINTDEQMEKVMDLQQYLLEGKVFLRDDKIPARNNSALPVLSSLISDYSDEEYRCCDEGV